MRRHELGAEAQHDEGAHGRDSPAAQPAAGDDSLVEER